MAKETTMNFVSFFLFWISLIGVYGITRIKIEQPILAQVFFQNSDELFRCEFPPTFGLTLVTKGISPQLSKLQKHTLMKTPGVHSRHLDWLSRHTPFPTRQKPKSASKERYALYESTSGDLHIGIACSKKSKLLSFVGALTYNSEEFIFRPINSIPSSLPVLPYDIIINKLHESTPFQEKSFRPDMKPRGGPPDRHRRETIELVTFTVDLLVVVDLSVFYRWQTRNPEGSEKEHLRKTRAEIKEYYNHVVNGIDSRYRNIDFPDFTIRVQMADVIIMDQQLIHSDHIENDKVNADTALKYFRNWTNETQSLPNFDHAILFVGYDLYTNTSADNRSISHTSGLAYIGTMCQTENSVSIVEEQGGFQSIGTAAHELGHSLGALHDGEDNECMSENRYIMAASGFGPVPERKQINPWKFSTCSIDYFRKFIVMQLMQESPCLIDQDNKYTSAISKKTHIAQNPAHQHTLDMPGQRYNPDEQCRLIWGPDSFLCRGSEFGDSSNICTAMYCRDPSSTNDCVLHTAARGTSCGDRQWCMDGVCLYSDKAPSKSAGCVLGDQPGKAFNGMTCEKLVEHKPSYCYQENVRARCCHSCDNKHRPVTGCEFGDRIQGCLPWHCNHSDQSSKLLTDCCETCNIGETSLSTQSPISGPSIVQFDPVTSSPTSECKDHGLINGLTCNEFVKTYGRYICYHESTRTGSCCQTCADIQKSNKGCEYGDRTPFLCAEMANLTSISCSAFDKKCCESCTVVSEQLTSGQIAQYIDTVILVLNILILLIFIK